ncbi:MAG: BON domain-containing protein [Planctomycetota bacterium]
MRRKYFGLALAAFATLGPVQAFGGDREIAQEIIGRLKASRDAGELKDFTLDMKVDNGVVKFRGNVNNPDQQSVVLATTQGLEGVVEVVNELIIRDDAKPSAPEATLVKPKRAAVAVTKAEPINQADSQNFAEALAEEDFSKMAAQAAVVKEAKSNAFFHATPAPVTKETARTATPELDAEPAVVKEASPADVIAEASPSDVEDVVAPKELPTPTQVAIQETPDIQDEVVDPAFAEPAFAQEVVPGEVLPTASYESRPAEKWSNRDSVVTDEQLVQSVVGAFRKAKSVGHLKGFAVNVEAHQGVLDLTGKCASDEQRDLMVRIAEMAPGAQGVTNQLQIAQPVAPARSTSVPARTVSNRTASLPALPAAQASQLQPMPLEAARPAPVAPTLSRRTPARSVSHNGQYINGEQVVPGSMVTQGGSYAGAAGPVSSGPIMGTPMPMAQAAAVGAPRYDAPNLPNYAWPGYAAYPNYAALSYPQQYSPSAFPYIGPFYPYPQVPLGWRKVSLEWDDGWWFLDFTDK